MASAYEQLAAVVAGALAAVLAFAVAGLRPPTLAWVITIASLAVAVLARPSLLGRWAARRLAARDIDAGALLAGRTVRDPRDARAPASPPCAAHRVTSAGERSWWLPNLAALRAWPQTAGFLSVDALPVRHRPIRGAGAGDHLVALRFTAP